VELCCGLNVPPVLVPGRIPAGEAVESFCYIRRLDAAPPHSSAISPGSLQSPALFTQFCFTIHPHLWLTGTPRRLLLARRGRKPFHDWPLSSTSCCFQQGGNKWNTVHVDRSFSQGAELTCRWKPHNIYHPNVLPDQDYIHAWQITKYPAHCFNNLGLIWLKWRNIMCW